MGLEHGFTVRQRPAGEAADEPLTLRLRLRGSLRIKGQVTGRDLAFGKTGSDTLLKYSGLKVIDANGQELNASFEADSEADSGERFSIVVEDKNATYPLTVDPTIAQYAYLKASNTGAADYFGNVLAISGETVIVGAPSEDSNATGVNGDQTSNGALASGAAYVFVRSNGSWSQQAYLKASNTGANDEFGISVAISGETVVVGAIAESSNATGVNGNQSDNSAFRAGAAYVFVRNGTTWSQQAYLKASNTGIAYRFGISVSISGETLVVGSDTESSSATGVNGNQASTGAPGAGAAYVFVRNNGSWSQQAYLKASNTDANDNFAWSVGISGETIVVTALYEASNATGVNGNQSDNSAPIAGAAYVFVRSGTTWSQQAYLKASNTESVDIFGISVGISGETIVVGARAEDSNATGVNGNQADNSASDSGAAYVFVRNGGSWSQQAYLKASNTDADDSFGTYVAVSGDMVVVGAPKEDSNATGVNGSQAGGATDSGAAYLFVRSGTTWSQQAYIKASNTDGNDQFATTVGISGETVVVGTWGEDSNATGVNGNQAGNSAANSGAAYVYNTPILSINGGEGQVATVGAAVATAPSVIVRDSSNTPIAGVTVTFAVTTGGGRLTGATTTTNASGVATVGSWTLGSVPGINTLTATSPGLTGSPLTFTATANSGAPLGPGDPIGVALGPVSAHKPGSLLIYNLYSSGLNPATNDSRISEPEDVCSLLLRRWLELLGSGYEDPLDAEPDGELPGERHRPRGDGVSDCSGGGC
ncbi:MAG: hypothetical protein EBZ36_11500 [Acidobacteria bacterium]|nr:hypothetical protein [Acidobacteriota bacterium]